ncbi:hypothetical protein B0T17DRAFT_592096 [Bombardia bombarda]|uniref:DOMON domain-containing protein n=1 Tax=Bombardia bombarda TaxID=252184 RepID=A0AA40BYI0_9PEZI|nr:hypothetical protein B0T17DRAFT_592096 [Bombardia bombarda]
MKTAARRSLLAAALSCASIVNGEVAQYCPPNNGDVCFRVAVPSSSASSGSGNIYFQISAPTTYAWVALGTGSRMSNANIFLMYQDGSGNLTLSPRKGTNYQAPVEDTSSTAAQLTLLAGSGVSGNTMTANIKCSNCETWSAGTLDLTSTSSNWVSAWRSGSSLATTDTNAVISQHDDTQQFGLDLTQLTTTSDSNPFLQDSTTDGGNSSSGSGSDSGSGSGSGSTNNGSPFVTGASGPNRTILVAHGVIMAIVMAILYPLGSLLLPLLGKWWFHAGWQAVTFCLIRQKLFTQAHTTFGTVVVCLMVVQPALGYLHHRQYLATHGRGVVSHIHIWWGRILMTLGVVNGGLGLQLSNERTGLVIAYSVVAGVIFLAYFIVKVWAAIGGRQRGRQFVNCASHTYPKMISPLTRASSKAVAAVSRLAVRNVAQIQMRTFIAPTVSRRADFVQELYLKELKAFKPTPVKDSDSVGQVSTFNLPQTPKSPEEADLASSLKEYESMAVEVEGQEGADAGKPAAAVEDWLVEEEEDDAHHAH